MNDQENKSVEQKAEEYARINVGGTGSKRRHQVAFTAGYNSRNEEFDKINTRTIDLQKDLDDRRTMYAKLLEHDYSLIKEVSYLQDKLKHASIRSAEVEYLAGQEIEKLRDENARYREALMAIFNCTESLQPNSGWMYLSNINLCYKIATEALKE
jgi:hypothetical protein